MNSTHKLRAGLVRPGDTLVDALGEEIGKVISTATPSPLQYHKEASITFKSNTGRQTIELTAGNYVRIRRAA